MCRQLGFPGAGVLTSVGNAGPTGDMRKMVDFSATPHSLAGAMLSALLY